MSAKDAFTGLRPDATAAVARPRIATVLPSLVPLGGLERLVITHAREYRERGYEVDFVFLNEPHDVRGSVPQGCRVFDLKVSRLRGAVLPLARYLRSERPDAVHATMWPVTSVAAVAHRLARSRARLVLSDHNPLSLQYAARGRLHRALLRSSIALTYPLADARVTVSRAVAEDLAQLSGLRRECFTVIHNPVAPPSGNADRGRADDAWRGWTGKRILTVGRLKAQKNHAMLVSAFRQLLANTDARLMILGTGDLAEALARQIEGEGLAGKVLMPGHVEDPVPYYRSADLFVLSSDYEGFGNVLVEALACGLQVVSTDCPGGPAEILESGRYGRLVPVRDEAALARAMAEALAQPADPDFLRSRARDFTAGTLVERYLGLLCPPDVSPLTPYPSNKSTG